MTLPLEWRNRVEMWKEELTRHYYSVLGHIDLEGFTTFERLSAQEAEQRSFKPYPEGTSWGAKWEYGWFRGSIELPEEAEGQRIAVHLEPGGESAVFINKQPAGCVRRFEDWQKINPAHLNRITLDRSGSCGKKYDLLIECYSGHGIRVAHAGPTPLGRLTIPEPPSAQVKVGSSTFGIWHEEVYQLWLDVETLYQLREQLEPSSLRAQQIDRGLKDFTLLVDFELPFAQLLETIHQARERLQPLLACRNGSTAPMMYAFGHSHLDICYQWPLAEARRKTARTFSTQMALMDEYPDYRFILSQPYLYTIAKRDYPQMYERLADKVSKGQIMPEGAMWVESDTNLPGGESLIRQFMYGLAFFKEEFGIKSELLWLPDVFGFSGSLPQIMRGCGVSYFSTSKLISNFVRGERFPYHTFRWRGIDGTEVLATQHLNYSAPVGPEAVMTAWKERTSQHDVLDSLIYPFGHGDGGGGPTRDHLEFFSRLKDLEGAPRMQMSHPVQFFEQLQVQQLPEAVYAGELYLKAHRGTLTSQAKLKKGNRRSEAALREAEFWSAWASWAEGYAYPQEQLEQVWKEVLLNQFHDILPGSCIKQVAIEADESYRKQEQVAQQIKEAAINDWIKPSPDKLTVFNSLSWERKALIELPSDIVSLPRCQIQELDGAKYTEVDLPAAGWITLDAAAEAGISYKGENASQYSLIASAEHRKLENECIAVTFNEFGEITSFIEKATGHNMAADRCNAFRMFKDVPTICDAWEIESMYEQQPVELPETAVITAVAAGPLFAALRIRRKLNQSSMTQLVVLRRGCNSLEFQTEIDWQEKHKLLKVCFPVDVHSSEAMHEIQFGHIKRPTHRSRQHDEDQFEVSQHKWTALAEPNRGAALLNDCKYGVNVTRNSINLTLLKAALAPDMHADIGLHQFTYVMMGWSGSFADSGVIRAGYELNHPAFAMQGDGGIRSLFKLSAGHIIIETIKLAEDRSGDLIVRMYEAEGTGGGCVVNTDFSFSKACLVNLIEEYVHEAESSEQQVQLAFRPFEIKTLRFAK
ncbi:alpha-mannosidase [Paenibacillus sp. IITD108]|uniref:alpha-mannosidase n=1 Tax=Paenibacillus sp. IITD108 TaxID=3116649 RepID=UPI002F40C0FE